MERATLNFSSDWGGKLSRAEFTTIRQDKGYWQKYVGQRLSVNLKGVYQGHALLFDVRPIGLSDISEQLAKSDANLSRADLCAMFEKMYGKNPKLQILFLKW